MSHLQDQPPVLAEAATFRGSCHCGHIAYSARFDFSQDATPTITKCNCSICRKSGYALLDPSPESSFKLLSPSTGLSDLPDRLFNTKTIHHYFCPHCGIRCFVLGQYEMDGKTVEFVNINANTLDQKEGEEGTVDLRGLKIRYLDGKSGDLSKPLADEPWEGGLW